LDQRARPRHPRVLKATLNGATIATGRNREREIGKMEMKATKEGWRKETRIIVSERTDQGNEWEGRDESK
jgi:hypothetical protein